MFRNDKYFSLLSGLHMEHYLSSGRGEFITRIGLNEILANSIFQSMAQELL